MIYLHRTPISKRSVKVYASVYTKYITNYYIFMLLLRDLVGLDTRPMDNTGLWRYWLRHFFQFICGLPNNKMLVYQEGNLEGQSKFDPLSFHQSLLQYVEWSIESSYQICHIRGKAAGIFMSVFFSMLALNKWHFAFTM